MGMQTVGVRGSLAIAALVSVGLLAGCSGSSEATGDASAGATRGVVAGDAADDTQGSPSDDGSAGPWGMMRPAPPGLVYYLQYMGVLEDRFRWRSVEPGQSHTCTAAWRDTGRARAPIGASRTSRVAGPPAEAT